MPVWNQSYRKCKLIHDVPDNRKQKSHAILLKQTEEGTVIQSEVLWDKFYLPFVHDTIYA